MTMKFIVLVVVSVSCIYIHINQNIYSRSVVCNNSYY